MSNLLNSIAVSRRGGEDAAQLLQAYVATPGLQMAENHALEAAPGQKPKGTGAGDHLVEPR